MFSFILNSLGPKPADMRQSIKAVSYIEMRLMSFRLSASFLLVNVFAFGQLPKLVVDLIAAEKLEQMLRDFPLKNAERQHRAKKLFELVNCPKIVFVPLGKKDVPANVVCILPGENQRAILVGAHFDKTRFGEGKIDNASGVVILSALVRSLQNSPRRHTFIFSAFAEEEAGLRGSATMVKNGLDGMSGKEFVAALSAMVNIDSVGAGVTAVALSSSDKVLASIAESLAEKLNVGFRYVNVDQVGLSDGQSFQKQKVRTIEFHSLDSDSFPILHTPKDNMTALRGKEYLEAYRLLAFYLAQLDVMLDQ